MFDAHLHSRLQGGKRCARLRRHGPLGLILSRFAATVASTSGNFASALASGGGKKEGMLSEHDEAKDATRATMIHTGEDSGCTESQTSLG